MFSGELRMIWGAAGVAAHVGLAELEAADGELAPLEFSAVTVKV